MAVDLWSEVTVCRSDTFEITGEGEGADDMPKDESNYLVVGCKKAFEAANKPMPILKYHVVSRIPYARGLGSSSAAIVAGIIAGLVLAGHRLPCWGSEALLQIAAGIEVCYNMVHIGTCKNKQTLFLLFLTLNLTVSIISIFLSVHCFYHLKKNQQNNRQLY
jgi:homoserine kinase